MNMIKAIFYRAKLTDEQLEKAKAAYTMLAQEKDAKTEDIMRKLSDAVRELLTDDQKEAMKAPMNVWTRPANPAPGQAQPGAPVDPKAGEGLKIELKPGATIVQPGGGAGGATVIITEGDEKK